MTNHLIIWICWGAFVFAWILGFVYNYFRAPNAVKRHARYDWLIFAIIAWLVLHYVPAHYSTVAVFHATWLQGLGTLLLLVSTAFTLWSRWVLGKMWATDAEVKEGHELVTTGPYNITRHPIYSGILGMILGSALSLGQGLAFLGLIAAWVFFMNRIRNEEKLMVMTFGEQYTQYKDRVPQLIPGLKPRTKQ